jgi:hypothetical protein
MKQVYFTLIISLVFGISGYSQTSDTDSTYQLILQNKKREKSFVKIKSNASIKIWVAGDTIPKKGILERYTDSTLSINGSEYAFDSIERITINKPKQKKIGIVATGGGLVLSAFGLALYKSALKSDCPDLSCIFYTFVGGAGMIIGVSVGVIGGILIGTSTMSFETERWELKRIQKAA